MLLNIELFTVLEMILKSPVFLSVLASSIIISEAVLINDIRRNNKQIPSLMKVVWALTVLYSGVVGLLAYSFSGRKQIERDSIWRRALRSVSHCYSGCGLGEATGVIVAVGLISLDTTLYVAGVTFLFAYSFGYAMTIGPLLQQGVSFAEAASDAFYTETLSITVMEVTAIGSDIILSDGAKVTSVKFWTALIISLTLGFIAAYPVNLLLIKYGVKEGMSNPKQM
jgi:hypothetical protein